MSYAAAIEHLAEFTAKDLYISLAISFGIWFFIYLTVESLPSLTIRSFDFKNRIVSFLHAIVSSLLTFFLIVLQPYEIGKPNTNAQTMILAVSVGYFAYDSIVSLAYEIIHKKINKMNLMHHIVTLSGLGFGYFSKNSGGELCLCLFIMEISNPCMHSIHIFRELGKNDSKIAQLNKYTFAAIFFFARIVYGTYLGYITLASPTTHFIIKVNAVGLYVVSVVWFKMIVRMATRSPKMKKKE